jgi:hypothetical protein
VTAQVLHADRSACAHAGYPSRSEAGVWTCPAGIPVTRVRAGGLEVEVGAAIAGLQQVAAGFGAAVAPLVAAGARLASSFTRTAVAPLAGAFPELRDQSGRGGARAAQGDPCGPLLPPLESVLPWVRYTPPDEPR